MNIPGPGIQSPFRLIQLSFSPYPLLDRWFAKYGPTFRVKIPFQPEAVFFTEAKPIRDIFSAGAEYCDSRELNDFLGDVMGQRTIFLLDGSEHRGMRRLSLPHFHGENLEQHREVIIKSTKAYLEAWKKEDHVILEDEFMSLTMENILTVCFGDNQPIPHLCNLFLKALMLGRTPWAAVGSAIPASFRGVIPRWRKFVRVRDEIQEVLMGIISERRSTPRDSKDFLSALLQGTIDGRPITDVEARDQLVTFAMAGAETTSIALTWAVYDILQEAEVLDRLQKEAAQNQNESPYTEAVIRESMRLRPVVPVTVRKLKKPLDIDGQIFPKDTVVAPCVYLAQRNPSNYKDPLKFDPDRFFRRKPDPNSWFPFGGGHRLCAGLGFAIFEMKLVLQTVFKDANLTLLHDKAPKMVRKGLFITASDGIPVRVAPPT